MARASAGSREIRAQIASAVASPPARAWVCVTARWFMTRWSPRAPASRSIVEPAVAVTAA